MYTGSEQSHNIKVASKKHKDAKNQTGEDGVSTPTWGIGEVKHLKRTRNGRPQVSASPRLWHKIGLRSTEALEEKSEKFHTYRCQGVGTRTNTKCNKCC